MLRVGLEMAGCEEKRQNRVCRVTQIANFKDMHGAEPVVCAEIWHDLQTTTIPEARINTGFRSCTMRVFLISLRFLKKCDTWKGRSASSGKGKNFCHTWGWCFLGKVAALRGQKIVWPEDDAWTTDFVIGIDGVHCQFHEVIDPTLSKNPKFFSHKFHGPGLGCELALSLFVDELVWLRGPAPAGDSDMKTCKSDLKGRIPKGKKAIVDGGHKDSRDLELSRTNTHDEHELRKLKSRAKARQEHFHSRVKRFKSVSGDFRHGIDRHRICFEAICVICQHEMELTSPLFDVQFQQTQSFSVPMKLHNIWIALFWSDLFARLLFPCTSASKRCETKQ